MQIGIRFDKNVLNKVFRIVHVAEKTFSQAADLCSVERYQCFKSFGVSAASLFYQNKVLQHFFGVSALRSFQYMLFTLRFYISGKKR